MNSNAAPFPLSLLMLLKVFVPDRVTAPPFAWMSAFEAVVNPLDGVNETLIVFSVRVPLNVREMREQVPVNCDVMVIAKY